MSIYPLAAVAVAIALAGCGGHSSPPPPVTIPDMAAYLAQSRTCDGNPATPLRDTDPIICRRFDFGHWQASESFLAGDGRAITTWSYAPWREFNAANGDGGELYVIDGDAARITQTQDGGTPGVQVFPVPWTVITSRTVDCAQGWTTYNLLERGCRTVVSYPNIGPVDTVVSEHGDANLTERLFLARGWGRLAWQAHTAGEPIPDLATRCPDFGWNHPPRDGLRLVDCRYTVNVEPADGSLTGARLWRGG